MPFSLDDMLESLGLPGQQQGRECYREEASNLKRIQPSDVAKLFPNVTLSESKQVVYAPFRLCHSLPKVNARGRGFTPETLSNSFASCRDGLVNVDHQMKIHSGGADTICGHIVCGRFDPEGEWDAFKKTLEAASKPKFPTKAIPLMALAAFYLQSQHVPAILDEHFSGQRKWLTSMECAHKWKDAAFLYRDEIIPLEDAEHGMRECVRKTSMRPYKGYPVALLLGGLSGKVDFHSAALTPDPADEDAAIEAFVTRPDLQEAANRGNLLDLPFERKSFPVPGLPSEKQEEITVEELASIGILGKTEPAEDGHVHDILTDGTVVPINGHTHCIANWSVLRGTTPRFTGRTDPYCEYMRANDGVELRKVHMHLLDIPLRGKAKEADAESTDEYVLANLATIPFTPTEDNMEIHELLKRIGKALSSGKYEPAQAAEIAALNTEIASFSTAESLKKLTATEVANKIASGELVTKEDAEKKAAEAAKAVADKAAAEKKEAEARTARREKVLSIGGIELDMLFNENSKLTVGEYIDSFGLDEKGEESFKIALATLEQVKKQSEATVEAPAAESTPVQSGTETVAANKGGKPAAKPAAKKPMLLVGSGKSEEGVAQETASSKPAAGRHLFKTAV